MGPVQQNPGGEPQSQPAPGMFNSRGAGKPSNFYYKDLILIAIPF